MIELTNELYERRKLIRKRPLGETLARLRRELIAGRDEQAEEKRRQTRRMLRSLERRL